MGQGIRFYLFQIEHLRALRNSYCRPFIKTVSLLHKNS